MADAKEIEIKLKATGGDAAAKEVAEVAGAVESVGTEASEAAAKVGELADATEEATKPQASPAKLVPAWEEVAEAAEDAGEAVEGTADAGESLDDLLGELKGRMGQARQSLDDLRNAADGASGSSRGGGLGGLVGNARMLVAQGTVVIGTIQAIAGVLRKIDAEGAAAMGRFAESGERMARALEGSDGRVADLAAEIDKAISPSRTLAGELERFSTAQESANAAFEEGVGRASQMASAYDAFAKSMIDLKVARGEMTAEEAAAAKGKLDEGRILREAADKVALAEREVQTAEATAREARRVEAEARSRAQEAEREAQEAGRPHRDRLAQAGQQAANAAVIGGLSPFDPSASRQAVELAGGEEAVKQMISEMEGWTGYMARWRLWMGQSVESILGAGERAEVSRMMAEDAAAEMEAAEANLELAEESAAKIAEEKARELEALRREREAADRQAKEAGAGLDRARSDQRIAADFAVPTARNRTDADLARIAAAKQDAERRANEKAADAYDKGKEDFDRDALGVAKGLGELLQSRGPGAEQSETGKQIAHMIKALEDGTDYAETGWVASMLGTLSTSLEVAQEVRAELAEAQREILRLHSGFKVIQSQLQHSPNRR